MKKLVLLLLSIIIFVGCEDKAIVREKVKTMIRQTEYQKVAINYPITNHEKLDAQIKKDVDLDYQKFQRDTKSLSTPSEFNLSYTYNILHERYVIITLTTMSQSDALEHSNNKIHTYVLDQKEKKILTLEDFISKEELKKILPLIKEALLSKYKDCILMEKFSEMMVPDFDKFSLFTLTEDYLILYYNPNQLTAGYEDIISIALPLDKIGLNIEFERGVFEEEEHDVIPIPEKVIDPNKKVIALTFDDGPSYYTDQILKLLEKEEVTATFFLIGNKINRYQETVQTMLKNGNEIGNHSFSHKWLTKLDDDDLQEEITLTQDTIRNLTGFTPRVFRPTYGAVNDDLKHQVNLTPIMWTVDSSDWKIKNANTIANRVLKSCQDTSIILMHDTHKRSYEALKIIIPSLKEQGYQFVTASELETVKKIRARAKFDAAE